MIQKLYNLKLKAILGLCFVLATSWSAAAQVELVPQLSSEEPVPGETFEITFTTEEATALYYYGLEVVYDQSRFSFQQITAGSLMGENPLQIADFVGEAAIGASVVRTSGSGDGAGTVATLVFEVLPDAETGEASFFFSNADIRDTAGLPVSVTLPESVSIIVQETEFFTVHYNNHLGWENVNAYAFQSNGGPEYLPWPGEAMNLPPDGSVWYSYDIPTTFDRVIFNNGAGSQTGNLERNTDGWFDGSQWYDSEPDLSSSRMVTFSVDMNVQEDLGNFDITLGDMVYVRGDFNDFGLDNLLTETAPGVYETEVEVLGSEGSNVEYKFFIDAGDDRTLPNGGWELLNDDPGLNRSFTLGEADLPQILDAVFFNDNEGAVEPVVRNVTFSVDMSVQLALGNFDPAIDDVNISGAFTNWESVEMTESSEADVYEITLEISGAEDSNQEYKFQINDDFEGDVGSGNSGNRVLTLGPADMPQILDTVFYNNDEGEEPQVRNVTFSVDMSVQLALGNFNPASDDVNISGAFTNWESVEMTESTEAEVYEITLVISGEESSNQEYKFGINDVLEGDVGPGENGNRMLTLGPADVPQILDMVFYNNEAGEEPMVRNVTFSVDMSVQLALGNFDPASDDINISGAFTNWESVEMTESSESDVYEITLEISGAEASNQEYKFRINDVLEGDVGPGENGNRVLTLGPAEVPQILDTVFFNNVDELPGEPEIGFANIQFPAEAVITEGQTVSVFAQVFIEGVTNQNGEEPAGIQSWIAVNDTDTDPSGWDESVWQAASFNSREGNNAEYTANIGVDLEPGTYYYASRFQYLGQEQVYGGTGGFWNQDSGVLTVEVATEFVDVWPGDTNNDGVVNEEDVLPLGIYWNQTGPARENATTEWTAQSAEVWDPVAATFADTDGSGIVNQTDLLAIGLNFGETHGEETQNSDPVLIVTLPFMNPGDRADITISATEALNLQGLSYALDFSAADEETFTFSTPEMAAWADAWIEDGQLIEFNRVDEGIISGARVHRGITEPESTEELFAFSITALEGWDQFSAELIIPRMTFVNQNGILQRIDEVEAEIVVETGTSTGGVELPLQTALNQNYPNPFNPTTNISFDLSEPSSVTLEVVNILGQRVALLINRDEMSAGTHVQSFDASRLTSGVYLLRMTAGNQTFSRKMMLVK